MGNSFIGFPVPRAKIADMIDGAAPPLVHSDRHEDGGDDEMDLSGLTGAGGVAFPLRGIWIDDYSADHTRWYKTYTGTGELTRAYDKLTLSSEDTNPSTGIIYRKRTQSIVTPTWEKKRHLVFQCYLDCDHTASAEMRVHMGFPGDVISIGFDVTGGKLYSLCRNAGGDAWNVIKTFSGGFIGEDIVLEVISFPGVKVEFWVNGILEHTETSRLPTGTTDSEYIFYLLVDNNSTTNVVKMDFSNIQFYQEP